MGFMINSFRLQKLENDFVSTAEIIRSAVNDKRPIWIRHHNDCDGYCAAIALEKAILKKLHDFHVKESDVFFFYKRFPTKTPFYDYSDATRDISLSLAEAERFNRKQPLLIIVDNGSSKEDLFALKKLQVYGIDVVVVDHHPNSIDAEPLLKGHINPHKIGEGSDLTAAMLCAELGRLIDGTIEDAELLAATGGIADKSDSEEIEQYIKMSEEKGFSREYLENVAEVIDFESGQLLNLEARQYVRELLFGDYERQRAIVDIVKGEIEQEKQKILSVISEYIQYEENENHILAWIDTDDYFNQRKLFFSKIAGLAKKHLEEKLDKPVVVLGYGDEIITIRNDKTLLSDVNELIKKLKEKFPYYMVQGGGHKNAGSIHFARHAKENIIKETMDYMRSKNG